MLLHSDLVSVHCSDQALSQKAQDLAIRLGASFNQDAPIRLLCSAHHLAMSFKGATPIFVDFYNKKSLNRRQEGRNQGLIKACDPRPGKRIVDATAGFGRDTALLAQFGAHVSMIERSPIMAALLADGLSRLSHANPYDLQIELEALDAKTYLQSLSSETLADVVYIDPMHPQRRKSALVKKDMQALQMLIGPDKDALELISLARGFVKERVVVKWPQNSASLLKPNYSIQGKTVRFDIYQPSVCGLISSEHGF